MSTIKFTFLLSFMSTGLQKATGNLTLDQTFWQNYDATPNICMLAGWRFEHVGSQL